MKKVILILVIIGAAVGLYMSRDGVQNTDTTGTKTVKTELDRSVSALGISIIPMEVTQDSRCPVDVQCVQAGTVTLRVFMKVPSGEASELLEFGKTIMVDGYEITLVEVEPEKKSLEVIEPKDYLFSFKVTSK